MPNMLLYVDLESITRENFIDQFLISFLIHKNYQ